MATYIPNATQTTEPVESRTVESAALEFRTLKASVNARVEAVQDNLDTEIVNRIAGDANLQTQNNSQDVRLTAIENAMLYPGASVQTGFTSASVITCVMTGWALASPSTENATPTVPVLAACDLKYGSLNAVKTSSTGLCQSLIDMSPMDVRTHSSSFPA